jgi:hypothetical protein
VSSVITGRRTTTIEVKHADGIKILKRIKRNHKLYPNLEVDVNSTITRYEGRNAKEVQMIKITISYDIKMRNK